MIVNKYIASAVAGVVIGLSLSGWGKTNSQPSADEEQAKSSEQRTVEQKESLVLDRIVGEKGDGSHVKATLRMGKVAKQTISPAPQGDSNISMSFSGGETTTEAKEEMIIASGTTAYQMLPLTGGLKARVKVSGEFFLDESLKAFGDSTWDGMKEGAVHVIMGTIEVFGYRFESDTKTPLTFKVTQKGYSYLTGSGTVEDKQTGTRIVLSQ